MIIVPSNVSSQKLLGIISTVTLPTAYGWGIAVSNGRVFTGDNSNPGKVYSYNLTTQTTTAITLANPANTLQVLGSTRRISAYGNYVYVLGPWSYYNSTYEGWGGIAVINSTTNTIVGWFTQVQAYKGIPSMVVVKSDGSKGYVASSDTSGVNGAINSGNIEKFSPTTFPAFGTGSLTNVTNSSKASYAIELAASDSKLYCKHTDNTLGVYNTSTDAYSTSVTAPTGYAFNGYVIKSVSSSKLYTQGYSTADSSPAIIIVNTSTDTATGAIPITSNIVSTYGYPALEGFVLGTTYYVSLSKYNSATTNYDSSLLAIDIATDSIIGAYSYSRENIEYSPRQYAVSGSNVYSATYTTPSLLVTLG